MVRIFGSKTCFYCLRCKQMCESMQIEHEYLEVEDVSVAREFKLLFPEAEGIPQIMWNDEHLDGYLGLTLKIDEYLNNINDEEK